MSGGSVKKNQRCVFLYVTSSTRLGRLCAISDRQQRDMMPAEQQKWLFFTHVTVVRGEVVGVTAVSGTRVIGTLISFFNTWLPGSPRFLSVCVVAEGAKNNQNSKLGFQ